MIKKILYKGIVFIILVMIAGCAGKESKKEVVEIFGEMGDIVSIQYSARNQEGTLIKENGKWQWEHNPELTLNQEEVLEEERTIQEAKMTMEAEGMENPSAYGLRESKYKLTVKDVNGQERTLHLGTKAGEDTYYATVDDKKDLYIVSEDILDVWEELAEQKQISEVLDAMSKPTSY